METPNPIIGKIKKLLALANDAGASEGERDNALRMAHAFLAKHNLDMQEVMAHGASVEERLDFANTAFGMLWCRSISQSVAKLFFCKYYYSQHKQSDKVNHHFVGKASNATTAALMAEYVNASIVKECRKRFTHNLSPESRAFGVGASDRIRERVAEMAKAENIEGVSSSTAIVLRDIYKTELEANEAFLSSTGVTLSTSKRRQQGVNASAYGAGKEFGNGVGLNAQVHGATAKQIK